MGENERYEKLEKLIDKFILDLVKLGFDVSGDKVGDSIKLEIAEGVN